MPALLTQGLGFAPYNLALRGLVPGGSALPTRGLGVTPYTVAFRGLTPAPGMGPPPPAPMAPPAISALLTRGAGFRPYHLTIRGAVSALPAPDLLSAVMDALRNSAAVQAVLTTNGIVQVWDELAPTGTDTPFVVLKGYAERLPGESLRDQPVPVTVMVLTSGMDQARSVANVVKSVLDCRNISPAAAPRLAFQFTGGVETGVVRNKSWPHRLTQPGRGGQYVYCEEIRYEFWVTPNL